MSDDLILEGLKIVLENYEIPRLTKLAIPIWNIIFTNNSFSSEVRSYRAQTQKEAIKKFIHQSKNNGLLQLLVCQHLNNPLTSEFLNSIWSELKIYDIELGSQKAEWLIAHESELIDWLIKNSEFKIIKADDYQSLDIEPIKWIIH